MAGNSSATPIVDYLKHVPVMRCRTCIFTDDSILLTGFYVLSAVGVVFISILNTPCLRMNQNLTCCHSAFYLPLFIQVLMPQPMAQFSDILPILCLFSIYHYDDKRSVIHTPITLVLRPPSNHPGAFMTHA